MEYDSSDEFKFMRASSGSAMRKTSNNSSSVIMSGKEKIPANTRSQGTFMLDRIAQITALVKAKKDVQVKIDQMFSEDQDTFDSAIRNMSKIDLSKSIIVLVDALHAKIQEIEATTPENSTCVHELMFALDKFRDSLISDNVSSSRVAEQTNSDLVEPQNGIRTG